MKKRTLSKLKSIFGSKKGKRQHQESAKCSRSPSPEDERPAAALEEVSRPRPRTPPFRVAPPPSPPVPTHPVAPVSPEPAGPVPLLPCPVCNRTFVPQSLAKHVKICEKMTIKKRKTFDSSRQRREGTDLEQYLPKNFGLPENSPFLEKSPPNTAKAAPKPKTSSVKSTIKGAKPIADLQKCPHCSRAFGVRAFERHVEWCADKAKILPAAPAQPPAHIVNAKQRLNARTQYKAPPVRNRRSSQSRDKSSNSRSASVDSSRGVSPPLQREAGDYRHGRVRASESMSSNDHDDVSPHVPVIKNSRNSHNSSGDTNVKARQARLARDLSSSRSSQEPPPIQQSSTDPNLKINPNKQKNKLSFRKQQQMKKLEEIANKYNERQQKRQEEIAALAAERQQKKKEEERAKQQRMKAKREEEKEWRNECLGNKKQDKSQIPIPKNSKKSKNQDMEDCAIELPDSPKPSTSKRSSVKTTSQVSFKEKKVTVISEKDRPKVKSRVGKRNSARLIKDSTMSLDSLEDNSNLALDSDRQSVGINTELLCVPCVIHGNTDNKTTTKKKVPDTIERNNEEVLNNNCTEPKVEFLFKNLTMTSSCDIQARSCATGPESKESLDTECLLVALDDSENNILDRHESTGNNCENKSKSNEKNTDNRSDNITNTKVDKEDTTEDMRKLSAEEFDEYYEQDISGDFEDSIENKLNTEYNDNEALFRHGSGDTYTKFTENPEDLEEFLNITDKMMSTHYNEEILDTDKEVEQLHTPKTNSIEAVNQNTSEENLVASKSEPQFSDTLEELKNNLKELLDDAGTDALKEKLKSQEEEIQDNRQVSDMEHITVYELKFYETRKFAAREKIDEEKASTEDVPEFKLPSITENNRPESKETCNKNKLQNIFKSNRKYKMLSEQNKSDTFIKEQEEVSDAQSISAEAPPLKLPRIEKKNKKRIDDNYDPFVSAAKQRKELMSDRLDDNYDPFASAARQMKELMSSDTNIPKTIQNCRNPNSTLPILRPKDKASLSYLNTSNPKTMKDSLNKTFQKTPTLQRMKSFGSTNNENTVSTFGGRCSSFRLNRNDKQKSSQKLNTTFTKSSKENISTTEKNYFNRSSTLNRSFSNYSSAYSTPKPKDKVPKIATSMYHSFQRTTIKQPVKLDKIKRDDDKKNFVNLDSILADDNSSMTDSNYIDPRLINENDNLPINVNTILNNPDIISSMESLLTTENLPPKFESFNSKNLQNNNKLNLNEIKDSLTKLDKIENNNNNKITVPTMADDLSVQYDKIMNSLEQSIASKTSIRDDDSLCEDFDLEEFMTSFDEEIHKHKETKRTCSSTTRVVKQSELVDSNKVSDEHIINSSSQIVHNGSNGLIPINKSNSLTFSSNNIVNESILPSSVKRSTSLLDSFQKKTMPKLDSKKSRHKTDQLEQDIMQSLKEFDNFYESERTDHSHTNKEVHYNMSHNGTTRRDSSVKSEKKSKKIESISNGNYTPNGKSNDSAYSSLNRISPSKLSVCNSKESNGVSPLDQIAGSDSSGCQKDEIRSVSSDEFLAMERSAELDEPIPPPEVFTPSKEIENPLLNEKRMCSRPSSRRSSSWRARGASLSSSGSEVSVAAAAVAAPRRLSRFCHECGSKFPVDTAKFCIECGVKRLLV